MFITLLSVTLLGVNEYATLVQMQIWLGIVPPLATLGIPDAMLVRSSKSEEVGNIYSSGLAATIFMGVLGGAATFWLFSTMVGASIIACCLAAFTVPVTLTSGWAASLEQRLGNFGAYNRLMIINNLVTLSIVALSAFQPVLRTATFVVFARLLGLAITVLTRLIVRRNYLRRCSWGDLFTIARSGSRFHSTAVLSVFATRIDQMVSSQILGSQALASLGLIMPLAAANQSIGRALGTVYLGRTASRGSKADAFHEIERSSKIGLLAGVGAAVALTGGFYLILKVGTVLGLGLPAPSVLTVLAAFLYLAAASMSATTDLFIRLHRAVNQVRPGIVTRIVSIAGSVGFSFLLIRNLGVIGSAATSFFAALMGLLLIWKATRVLSEESARG